MPKDITKQEVGKIIKLNKNLVTVIQDFLIREFKLIKVDDEYLELQLADDLLEVRVYGLIDSANITVRLFTDGSNSESATYTSIRGAYVKIKSLLKGDKF